MDLGMVEAVLGRLREGAIIRLNYSGESGNYPWLIEAIGKAKMVRRSQVEMVTSLVSMPLETVRRLAASGIDRISISLHTLAAAQFPLIYGGGGLESFSGRLETLLEAARRAQRPPAIDFAMVALESNLIHMPAIASVAARSGAALLSVHPVIRRPGVPAGFNAEAAENGVLTPAFEDALGRQLRVAQARNPELRISVARTAEPCSEAGPFTCEQNPFETTHVLSNGDVVVCEVLDRVPMGNVRSATLDKVWTGPSYQDFRARYERDDVPECGQCIFRRPARRVGAVRTLWGWYPPDSGGALWSRTGASFEFDADGQETLLLKGLLPDASPSNTLRFLRDGVEVGAVHNQSRGPMEFELRIDARRSAGFDRLAVEVEHGFSPWRRGAGSDTRELGFALFDARFENGAPAVSSRSGGSECGRDSRRAANLLLDAVFRLERLLPSQPVRHLPRPADSLGVVIPERGDAAQLSMCLSRLNTALRALSVPAHVVIVVNGSARGDYVPLMARHPEFQFVFNRRPLGFASAVDLALRRLSCGWTYLLNSDMLLDQDALERLLPHRAPDVFSLASSIRMRTNGFGRETNRTSIEFVDGLPNLLELDARSGGVVEHAYSGGGSSLFQTAWLRTFVRRTRCYDPFYWEDAEWGVLARRHGLCNLFVPDSQAEHVGRATVNRYYDAAEVARIFERNRIQFCLRCLADSDPAALRERLAHASGRTIRELFRPRRLLSMARARAENKKGPIG